MSFLFVNKNLWLNNLKTITGIFQCFIFALKWLYICDYIICIFKVKIQTVKKLIKLKWKQMQPKFTQKNHYIRTVCRWHWSYVPFGDVYRPWLAKHSPKRQIEHVTNAEKYWTSNRNKLLKKWHEKSRVKSNAKMHWKYSTQWVNTREYLPPSNNKYYPTAGSETMYELQRTQGLFKEEKASGDRLLC